ncbi:BT4734/BF3469 family protein [Pontibacter sp. SGAir0037]|uniref:BT4734/BF3469 family protein n=1 Tax=Pontibacter sp. SGAir0037 TaxID=2571030 RepID=UPI0010CCD96F|nr:BT4734/BF3469 family protein [Pontibacter sp. SGAir0037]QCR23785.1 hypothetical protein C1N53_16465 [Pontibacter sp. SGAir0037]
MNKVSIFPKINVTRNGSDVELLSILNDICDGRWREVITTLRNLKTEEEQKQFKSDMLPYFTVSGTFRHRDQKGLEQHSGFACLDIDKKQNPGVNFKDLRKVIEKDNYTYSCFLSCRGWDGGLAVIVKIPTKYHEASYRALKEYFETTYSIALDKTSNVAWPRYVSYDPELYLNHDSETFEELQEEEAALVESQTSPCKAPIYPAPTRPTNYGHTALQTAVRKILDAPQGSKHHMRRDMAYLCGGYVATGLLSEHEAQQALEQAIMHTSPKSAWKVAFATVRSGIKKGQEKPILPEPLAYIAYESKSHGDQKELVAQKIAVSHGGNAQAIQAAVEAIYEEREETILAFWDVLYDEKKDIYKLHLSHVKYAEFLDGAGFRKYRRGKDVSIVRVSNNIVSEVVMDQIQTFILDYLNELPFHFDHVFRSQVIDQVMREHRHFFDERKMGFLRELQDEFLRDDKDTAYFFYRNGFVTVKPEAISFASYTELPSFIWQKQIRDRDIQLMPADEVGNCDFSRFLYNSSGQNQERLLSLYTLIGYECHGYKDPSNTKVAILVDQAISENPSGGTGKSLIFKAIGKVVPMVLVDCKTMDFKDKFWSQEVNEFTRVVFFDDWDGRRLPFDKLFVMATGEMKINRLYQGQTSLAYETSPKIGITTNDMISGAGDSHARRKFEFEIAPYYSKDFNPKDEFGRNFFDDWEESEWNSFDNLMMGCCQLFLKRGLLEPAPINLNRRKLLQATRIRGQQTGFASFMDAKLKDDKGLWLWAGGEYVISKPGTFEDFKSQEGIPDGALSAMEWDKWLKLYAQFEGLDVDTKKEKRDDIGNKFRAAIFSQKIL